eukprot:TRINITY_DN4919_c0_g2_i1.p1 TRINITY_DN4919_c0_g2~~TRINITY_DN4919_c0_g2_i1.p1  ORF type:complete len:523 (+),score=97.79 TRINITY_DN4919_c0_g2_i1:163-1731(+)
MAPITIYEALAVTVSGIAAMIVFISAMNGPSFSRIELADPTTTTTIMPSPSATLTITTANISNSNALETTPSSLTVSNDAVDDCYHSLLRWGPTRDAFHDDIRGSKAFYRPATPSDDRCTYGNGREAPVSLFCHVNYDRFLNAQTSMIATLFLGAVANMIAILHIWGCCNRNVLSLFLGRVVFWVTIVGAAFGLQVRGRLSGVELDTPLAPTSLPAGHPVICTGEYRTHDSVVNLWVVGACLLLPLLWVIVREPVNYEFGWDTDARDRQRRRRRRNHHHDADYSSDDDDDGEDEPLPSYNLAVARLWRLDPEGMRTDLPSYREVQPTAFELSDSASGTSSGRRKHSNQRPRLSMMSRSKQEQAEVKAPENLESVVVESASNAVSADHDTGPANLDTQRDNDDNDDEGSQRAVSVHTTTTRLALTEAETAESQVGSERVDTRDGISHHADNHDKSADNYDCREPTTDGAGDADIEHAADDDTFSDRSSQLSRSRHNLVLLSLEPEHDDGDGMNALTVSSRAEV